MKRALGYLKTFAFLALLAGFSFGQQSGSVTGQVTDSVGDAVVGATVTVVDKGGNEKTTVTNGSGVYSISGLTAGRYTIRAFAENFAMFEATDVDVFSGSPNEFPIMLNVEGVEEEVEVTDEGQVSTDAQNNASALVLKEEDLAALPDDPDDLEAALQALAGGAAGPNGGQIYIDGFQGGNLPPKEAIREIRINQNPFSAEYDRLGFGRIEILTRPGSDKFRGQAFFNFNDDFLNTRNPFAENKADSTRMFYGGNISGPVIDKKASFFVNIDNRRIDNGSIVNATVIDSNFNAVPFQQEFTIPSRRFSIGPRFDYAINQNNTLVFRYEFERRTAENQGIGGFSLPTRGTESENTEHTFQVTETAILNAKTVNETRFQFRDESSEQLGDNTIPAINVSGAFVGGGSSIGLNYDKERSWELQNYTTTALGRDSQHAIKFGVRLRGTSLEDRTESNYGGTFTFAGFLNDNGTPGDTSDDFFVSSIEQYRQKLLGNPDPRYNPNQFSITTGNPLADISQYEVGAFITDDWRVNPGLTLSFGLRYENQTNISDKMNFAPRFSFAYSPGAGGQGTPKTVFRGGFGIFYNRFSENLALQALRLDGTRQQQYIIGLGNPLLAQPVFTLDGVTNVPTADQLALVSPLSSIPRIISPELQAPYTIQGAFSVERQLPGNSTVSVYYVTARDLHTIRSRNINAPVCPPGFDCPVGDPVALAALRPDPTTGNIYQYESSGYSNSQRLIFSFRTFFSQGLTLFSNYILANSKSNSDGGFPAYSYDISDEYSNSSFDTRHTFFMGGSVNVPFGISLRPFKIARSGSPFDITSGIDSNGDSIFNDRPTFGELAARCDALGLTASWCDVSGYSADATLPRNYGRGPSFFTVNLGIDRTFSFGGGESNAGGQGGPGGGGIPGMGRGGRGGGMRGGFFGGNERGKYNLTLGVRVNNLLNTTNESTPVGNLSSSLFGQSTSTAGGFGRFGGGGGGNRTVELQARFRW
ncbi:MAG: TonB-dependent receptor [Aridibacter famidurans]|nr:TonB-dependent receptor [Aridibacter famidurans]